MERNIVMYCFNCGEQIQDNAKFCQFCGTKIDNQSLSNNEISVEKPSINYKKIEQDIQKGMRLYLQDVMNLEFSVNKLQKELLVAKEPIIIHDEWYFTEHFLLEKPIRVGFRDPMIIDVMGLSYSYRLNKYYYMFYDKRNFNQISYYTDFGEEEVNHEYGRPYVYPSWKGELTKEKRDQLCTIPIVKSSFFSGNQVTNASSTYWSNVCEDNNWDVSRFAHVQKAIGWFEEHLEKREEDYRKNLPTYEKTVQEIETELEGAKRLLKDLYSLNIIPTKYRNIGCAYFIYDYFSTSNSTLDSVFLHLDLDKIQSQLDEVINNQQDIILQQAVMISQNEAIIAQNRQLFDELSNINSNVNSNMNRINENISDMSQWTKIAALNAEACTWIGMANYLK